MVASQAAKPITNHFVRSKGWKRIFLVVSNASPKGAKISMCGSLGSMGYSNQFQRTEASLDAGERWWSGVFAHRQFVNRSRPSKNGWKTEDEGVREHEDGCHPDPAKCGEGPR